MISLQFCERFSLLAFIIIIIIIIIIILIIVIICNIYMAVLTTPQ